MQFLSEAWPWLAGATVLVVLIVWVASLVRRQQQRQPQALGRPAQRRRARPDSQFGDSSWSSSSTSIARSSGAVAAAGAVVVSSDTWHEHPTGTNGATPEDLEAASDNGNDGSNSDWGGGDSSSSSDDSSSSSSSSD